MKRPDTQHTAGTTSMQNRSTMPLRASAADAALTVTGTRQRSRVGNVSSLHVRISAGAFLSTRLKDDVDDTRVRMRFGRVYVLQSRALSLKYSFFSRTSTQAFGACFATAFHPSVLCQAQNIRRNLFCCQYWCRESKHIDDGGVRVPISQFPAAVDALHAQAEVVIDTPLVVFISFVSNIGAPFESLTLEHGQVFF